MEAECPPTVAEEEVKESRVIGDWKENTELGTWIYKSDEIEIHISMWQHLDFKQSYTLCLRWEYKLNNFATYIKVLEEEQDIEKLLMHGAGFVTNWLAQEKEKEAEKVEIITE